MRIPLLAVAALMFVAGCVASEDVPVEEEPPPEPEDVISAVGTVRYIDLEGGFYGITVTEGLVNPAVHRYLPVNLAEPYREDGVRVRFRAVPAENVATIFQWGLPIVIRDIQPVDVR